MNGLYRPIELPGLSIPGNLILAPLAGYTDAAFRSICLEHGASFCFTEMVSAEGIARGSTKSFDLLHRSPGETMWGVQLFGCEPESAAAAVRAIEPLEPRLYDLNCGCSVPKVLKSGAGAALLRDPERIYRLVAAMKVETQAPVSVKLRSGWDLESLNYPETAAAAVAGGASLVTLHPRIRSQGFGGKAVWDHIRILKNALKVPVVGSGDLFRPEDALRMLATTGCDGVMFARGALGNPFVFACSRAVLCDEPLPDPAPSPAKLCTALEQLRRSLKYKKEETACKEMRKHFCYYTRGVPGGAQLRKQIATATRYVEYESVVKEYLHRTDGIDKGENPIER